MKKSDTNQPIDNREYIYLYNTDLLDLTENFAEFYKLTYATVPDIVGIAFDAEYISEGNPFVVYINTERGTIWGTKRFETLREAIETAKLLYVGKKKFYAGIAKAAAARKKRNAEDKQKKIGAATDEVKKKRVKGGSFEIIKIKNGYCFNLLAKNGKIIATSEAYSSLANCKKGIASVKRNAPVARIEDQTKEGYDIAKHPKFEIYTDRNGEFRFRLKATNGQIVAVSEGYTTKPNCEKGVASVVKNSEGALIVGV